MTGKLITAVAFGLLLGVAGTSLVVRQPEARGQEPERKQPKQQWEYKVLFSSAEVKDPARAMTEQYNLLAAEGWEYVGPVVERTHSGGPTGGYTGIGGAYVLFKRSK
jgi:hypothetical protein